MKVTLVVYLALATISMVTCAFGDPQTKENSSINFLHHNPRQFGFHDQIIKCAWLTIIPLLDARHLDYCGAAGRVLDLVDKIKRLSPAALPQFQRVRA
jgi:hypothetical protein